MVRDYYAAIRAHDFLRAYRMWETSGQRNVRSYAQFAAGFDSTETVDVKIGATGRVEGAAGSRYVTVPVEIDSRLRNGTRQKFTGTYTLRRVVVPGASAAQRRWHLYAASIRQVQPLEEGIEIGVSGDHDRPPTRREDAAVLARVQRLRCAPPLRAPAALWTRPARGGE